MADFAAFSSVNNRKEKMLVAKGSKIQNSKAKAQFRNNPWLSSSNRNRIENQSDEDEDSNIDTTNVLTIEDDKNGNFQLQKVKDPHECRNAFTKILLRLR